MLVISGLLTSLPLIITELGFLQWISIIPAAYVLIKSADESKSKVGMLCKLYGMGVIYFGAYYALSFHWFFYMYPLDFAGLDHFASLGIVVLACFGLGLFQAVQSAVAFVLYGIITRTKLLADKVFIRPIIAATLFVIFEWWQTIGWWGVPWARIPLGQLNALLLVRSSAVFGSYFVTFVVVAVSFFLALAIYKNGIRKSCIVAALTVFCLNIALGVVVTLTYRDDGQKVVAAATQGNFSSKEKWDVNIRQEIKDRYAELTEKAAKEGADVVVWPETAIPEEVFNSKSLMKYLTDLAKENDVTIIMSAFTTDDDKKHNSIIEVKPDGTFGERVYSKQKLVPFGEYVPMRPIVTFLVPALNEINMLGNDLAPGEESVVMETDVGTLGFCVCFDSIYEQVTLDSVSNGAELIMISTNDSWFSDSAALDMHNGQARLRAIETGRYVVRSANTGISSIIDPMGNVNEELGAQKEGYIVSNVYLRDQRTVYSYVGNLFVYICMVFISVLSCIRIIEEIKSILKPKTFI